MQLFLHSFVQKCTSVTDLQTVGTNRVFLIASCSHLLHQHKFSFRGSGALFFCERVPARTCVFEPINYPRGHFVTPMDVIKMFWKHGGRSVKNWGDKILAGRSGEIAATQHERCHNISHFDSSVNFNQLLTSSLHTALLPRVSSLHFYTLPVYVNSALAFSVLRY